MANSTSNIDAISVSQASKEVTANAFFDAASQAATYGRRASNSSGLTWGYYGGNVVKADGGTTQIANGTLTLAASATSYIVAAKATGAVSAATTTTNWDNVTDYWRLYSVVAGAETVTSWSDLRAIGQYTGSGSGGGGGGMTNPMTTSGDIITGGSSGAPQRLAPGTNGLVLKMVSGAPAWAAESSGGSSSSLAASAWVELAAGNDTTGAVGDITKPFLTINAALDALPATGGRIFLSRGAHAPITDDYLPGTGLDPASKLKSNVMFVGAGMPELNHPTAPTGLNANTGTVIKGPIVVHSTRHNVKFRDLGVDSGSDVCADLYSGVAQEGVGWFNVGQIDGQPQARGAEIHNVISLCKAANSPVHAICLENVINPSASNIRAYFGVHGLALKAIGGVIDGLYSYGHGGDVIIIKESNSGNDTAPSKKTVISNVVGGALSAGDTPIGIFLETADTRDLEGITISGVSLAGIGTYELHTAATGAGRIRNIRIDGMTSDGAIRTSLHANTDKNSVFVNGDALGALTLTDGSTINTDASSSLSGGVFSVTPGAAGRTLANPTNMTVGKTYLWLINTGSGTITSYGSLFSFLPNTTPTTSASAGVDVLTAVYDGTKLRAVYSKP